MLDKNADYLWLVVRLNRAWLHLHAMDFAGRLAIGNSTPPAVREESVLGQNDVSYPLIPP
jgi:hypothetical protein